MATGYTADLSDGKPVSFEEFALRCARGFDSLIDMRDMALDAKIPAEIVPSTYHFEAAESERSRLAEIKNWNAAQAEKKAKADFNKIVAESKKEAADNARRAKAYVAMIVKVFAWEPPTEEHVALKNFMLAQLTESLNHDCFHEPVFPRRLSWNQYRNEEIEMAKRNIAYHEKEYKSDVKTAQKNTEWITQLVQSLK